MGGAVFKSFAITSASVGFGRKADVLRLACEVPLYSALQRGRLRGPFHCRIRPLDFNEIYYEDK